MNTKTLFYLQADKKGIFDNSVKGQKLKTNSQIKNLKQEGMLLFEKGGSISIENSKDLNQLDSFTIEARIRPKRIGERMNIAEAQAPSAAFFIEKNGQLTGSIHTARGWQSIDSGEHKVSTSREQEVRFIKENSSLILEIDGKEVGRKVIREKIKNVGNMGFQIGTGMNGSSFAYEGMLGNLRISEGGRTSKAGIALRSKEQMLMTKLIRKLNLPKLEVSLDHDTNYARLQPVKNILNAAGVERLSDLDQLNITQKTIMQPGRIMIAPRKSAKADIDWGKFAKDLGSFDLKGKQVFLANNLVNKNSIKVIKSKVASPTQPNQPNQPTDNPIRPHRVVKPFINLNVNLNKIHTANFNINNTINLKNNKFELKDPKILDNLKGKDPMNWPGTEGGKTKILSLTTLPINSAVIIAGTFNLSNTQLEIAHEVETLYIIAEKIICDPNSTITWKRPGGSTPAKAGNPDLNGRSYSGKQLKPNSKNGLDGKDGRAGEKGINGAEGLRAPNLQIWTRDLSSMPNFDLNGETGITGGKGQTGGKGGNGADGDQGKYIWAFGYHCVSDPGDGGDGGNGGRGGDGGRGGNGGDGGDISIGVLDGTLESSVTSRSFRIKNEGGQKGEGGPRGEGGNGGRGGRSGAGQYCKDASNGHTGAQGQPGERGSNGPRTGKDGKMTFLEFSEDAWEDLLTRPYLLDITPDYVFPSDSIKLKGSYFTPNDKVSIDDRDFSPTENPDGTFSVNIPGDSEGGEKTVFIKRQDGTESNRLTIWVKPQLGTIPAALVQGSIVNLTGKAFLNGATVLVNGEAINATRENSKKLSFMMPGTGGTGSTETSISLQVRNPDGLLSNTRSAYTPYTLEIPFQFDKHSLSFKNFKSGAPSWGTYQDTFGAAEIWHEQFDPLFGHPITNAAFFAFYHYFLKGEDRGGLATGFCTALSCIVLDEFWQGRDTTMTKYDLDNFTKHLFTGIHGKLLSRESLIAFHDQGQEGTSRVLKTYRQIEKIFYEGCDRNKAPMLFFIPSGAIWDDGYIDRLGDSHCIVPVKFVYPQGHGGPRADGLTDPEGVRLYCWDCNHPYIEGEIETSLNCYVEFRRTDGEIRFDYFTGVGTRKFCSEENITLGMMSLGDYHLADHDLPFSGPHGVKRFVFDFLLSPADMQITDSQGLRTGLFGNQYLSEIPDSGPCYLAKGAYLLPGDTALMRTIKGTGSGKYVYNSVTPDGSSFVIEDMTTAVGQEDQLSINADGTQIRFTPGNSSNFKITLARQISDQVRAIAIEGVGGGPTADVDITISPELSLCRVGNQANNKSISVRAFSFNSATQAHSKADRGGINLPVNHDLVLAVTNWEQLNLEVETIPF